MLLRGAALTISVCLLSVSTDGFSFGVRSGTRRSSSLSMSAALIVQNKGGGHGELGYQLAKNLLTNPKISSITILQDDACNDSSEPFASYSTDLPSVRVVKAPLGDESLTSTTIKSLLGDSESSYTYVWDNASKNPTGLGKAICDCAKDWKTELYTYVSSAGMYLPEDGTFPMPETTPVKESAGQNLLDAYAVEIGLPLVSFRPQYIYGKKASKFDYVDWYFDRLSRGVALPVPGDGTQKVSLTNSEDVASLLASVLEKPEAAIEQRFFNCGSNKLYSYDEVAYLCAEVMGLGKEECLVEHYDAEKGKAKFPFRLTDFYVAPSTAMTVLGWGGAKTSLKEDLVWYYEGYKARGGAEKEMTFEKDAEVLQA